MIIYTSNLVLAPLAALVTALIWGLDLLLALAVIRLVAARVGTGWGTRLARSLEPLVDPVPRALGNRFAAWRGCPVPAWAGWVGAFLTVVVVQYVLVMVILALA